MLVLLECCYTEKGSLTSTHLIKSSHGVDPIANMHYHTTSKQVTMDAQRPLILHIRGTIWGTSNSVIFQVHPCSSHMEEMDNNKTKSLSQTSDHV